MTYRGTFKTFLAKRFHLRCGRIRQTSSQKCWRSKNRDLMECRDFWPIVVETVLRAARVRKRGSQTSSKKKSISIPFPTWFTINWELNQCRVHDMWDDGSDFLCYLEQRNREKANFSIFFTTAARRQWKLRRKESFYFDN